MVRKTCWRPRTSVPLLARSSLATHGTCLARETPWLYFGFAVPERTGGQTTDRQPGADTDWAPGQSASPDPDPYDLIENQFSDRNVRPTGLLDRPLKDD